MSKEATQETQQSQAELETFNWDDPGDFNFDEMVIEDNQEEKVEEKEEKQQTTAEEQKEQEKEEEDNDDVFSFEETAEEESGKVKTTSSPYKELTQKLKQKGIFQNVEIPEDEEVEEDKFFEYHDKEIEARVDEALEDWSEQLDEDGKAFIKFKKEGGKTEDFLKTYREAIERPSGDLKDESYQEKLSRYYYKKVEGLDPEDIDDRIQWLKDSGKLEKYAEKHDEKITEMEASSKQNLVEKQKEQARLAEEAKTKFVDAVRTALEETDEVGKFKFTPKLKKELLPFITKPTVKVGKNQYITGVQDKLKTALRDPSKMLILAKLLYNDFDVSDIEATTTTQQTRQIKGDLQRKEHVKVTSSGQIGKKRSLADYF